MRKWNDVHPKVAAGLASAIATVAAFGAAGVDLTFVLFTVQTVEVTWGTVIGVAGFLLGAYGWPEEGPDELEAVPQVVDESGERDV